MNPATGVALGDRPVAGSVAESPNAAQILSGTLPTGHQQETSMMRSILRDALRHGTRVTPALALAAVATLASCGDNGAGPSTTALSISLTDAPGDIQHAFVTITEIQLVGENGILVLRDEPYTADLLTLAGQTADLVTGFEVTSGTYEQLRFLISGACIAAENASGGPGRRPLREAQGGGHLGHRRGQGRDPGPQGVAGHGEAPGKRLPPGR